MKSPIIAITTGDVSGIGLEVTMKALAKHSHSNSRFLIWKGAAKTKRCWKPLPKNHSLSLSDIDSALSELKNKKSPYRYIELSSSDNPAIWVRDATKLCLMGELDGLVTGPVSKKTFYDANLDSLGHTPLLQKLCGVKSAYMGFLGKHFNVILLTGHIPLQQVQKSLTREVLRKGFDTILKWQTGLPTSLKRSPLGVLGLNPHKGEQGLIGNFEKRVLEPLIADFPRLSGPLVPDAAFAKENHKKYSFYLALYHDQGLIPFKMMHGHLGGAHVTVGLPIIRTSVDHGTAFDLFGKGIARHESMRDAIQWCETLIGKKG